LGGRKGIRPVKKQSGGAGMVVCLEQGADLHMAQLTPLPLTNSCFSKIQIGFIFLVPAHPGSPGKKAVKRVCVCVLVLKNPLFSLTNIKPTKESLKVLQAGINYSAKTARIVTLLLMKPSSLNFDNNMQLLQEAKLHYIQETGQRHT